MRLVADPVELLARQLPLLRDLLGGDPLHDDVVPVVDQRRHRAVVRPHRDARHHLDAARDDEVELPRPDCRRRVEVRLHRGAALAVDRRAGDRDRPAGGERDVAADVPRLLVDLRHAAPLHVLDLGGIDAVPLHERVHDLRRELVAADVRERPVLLADRAANRIDDHCAGLRHARDCTAVDAAQERQDRAAEAGSAVRPLLEARARGDRDARGRAGPADGPRPHGSERRERHRRHVARSGGVGRRRPGTATTSRRRADGGARRTLG